MDSSKLPNQTSTTPNSLPIIDFAQCEDSDQIQLPSPYNDLTPSKEDCIGDFIKRRSEINKKIIRIYQQTEDEKTKVLELRRLIFFKPLFQEAATIQNLLKNSDADLSRKILQELIRSIKLSIFCFQHLHEFYNAQQSPQEAEKIKRINSIIESAWQQIYKLSIYDPLLISKVCQLEWNFRAIEVLGHDRADSQYPFIEYCELLKKGALASQSKEIITSKLSRRIEEELQKYQGLIQRVQFVLSQEGNPVSAWKMDVQQVQKLLQELKEFGFGMKQETGSVEEALKTALKIEEKFDEFLKKKVLVSPTDLFELMLKINNCPLRLTKIEEQITKLFIDQEKQVHTVLQETIRRITEETKELSLKHFRDIQEISLSYGIRMQETKEIGGTCRQEVQKITKKIEEMIQGSQAFNFEDFCILSREVPAKDHELLRAELWLAKVRLLQIFCGSLIKPSQPVTFEEIQSFLPEVESYVNSLPVLKRAPFDEMICFLHCLLHDIKTWIGKEQEKRGVTGEGVSDKTLYGFIDVTKEIAKPSKEKRQSVDLELRAKWIQFRSQRNEILNRKRSRIENLISRIDSSEKIEKKVKKSQPEIVVIDSEDE